MNNIIRRRLGTSIAKSSLVIALLAMPLPLFAVEMIPDVTVRASELSGTLPNLTSQDFFRLEPTNNDSEVTLTLTFGAQNDGRVANQVNFRIFDQAGLNNLQDGIKASVAAFGGGNPIFGKDDDYKVSNTFTVAGRQGYTVMVYSSASIPANYTLRANNALLVDSDGKTQSPAMMAESATMIDAKVIDATLPATLASESTIRANTSRLINADNRGNGDRQYYTLRAVSNDEEVTLTFDYNPQDSELLSSEFNFYVFSDEALRQLEAGGRPENINLAAGNLVKLDETKLSATFRSVGNQLFTVIVVNRSQVAASYTLAVAGADFQ